MEWFLRPQRALVARAVSSALSSVSSPSLASSATTAMRPVLMAARSQQLQRGTPAAAMSTLHAPALSQYCRHNNNNTDNNGLLLGYLPTHNLTPRSHYYLCDHGLLFQRFSTNADGGRGTASSTDAPPTSEETTQQSQDPPQEQQQEQQQQQSAAANEPSKEEQLVGQIKDLKEQLLYSLAEQDNTRRIAQRDVEQARQFAIRSFAKSLLDVSDNLTRALESVPPELVAVPESASDQQSPDPQQQQQQQQQQVLTTLYRGIQMTQQHLTKAFESNGLVQYGTPGDTFDPNLHDALFEYVDTTKPVGTVGQVMKPGFMLNRRVLRPAEVGVIKKQPE